MKYSYLFFTIVLVGIFSFATYYWGYCKQKNINSHMNIIIGEKYFLDDSFKSLLTTDSIVVDNVCLAHGKQKVKLLEVVRFPCLVIYLPSIHEDICNSCIEYALNSAMEHIENFSLNKHACIISVNANPEIKERIYKKECYVTDLALLNIPQTNMPYYFILEKNGSVNHLFAPNLLFEKYVDIYFNFLKCKYPFLQ